LASIIKSRARTIVIDKGYDRVVRGIFGSGTKPFAKIGFPAKKPKGKKEHTGSKLRVVDIAVIHEFGAPRAGIPERSWMRTSYDENLKKNLSFQTSLLNRMLSTKRMNIKKILRIMAQRIKTQQQRKIRSNIPPKLKTRKGIALIDTAQMINSIQTQVVVGKAIIPKITSGLK